MAKFTGISRSNVYSGLSSLVEHGAAYVMEGESTKYIGTDLDEFCENRIFQLQKEKEFLCHNLPKKVVHSEGFISVEGYENICNKIRYMLQHTQMRAYFSASGSFLIRWKDEMIRLSKEGRKVVLIAEDSYRALEEELSWKNQDKEQDKVKDNDRDKGIILYRMPEEMRESKFEDGNHQIRLIIDSEYVLTGEVGGEANKCLYSTQKNFVNVFKDAMKNEIELINIKKGNGIKNEN